MEIKNQSNELVLDSGKKQSGVLAQNMYLHNFKGNYEEISEDFTRVKIALMDKLWEKIIAQQENEEKEIYRILGIEGIEDLNKKYLEAGGQTEFLSTTATELISEASKNALVDLTGRTSQRKTSSLSKAVGSTLEQMIEENVKNDEEMVRALKKGLGEKTAKILVNLQKKKDKPKKMDDYIERASKAISAQFRGDILEIETGVAMARLIDKLAGEKGRVSFTGTVKNAQGKQIKADHTVHIDEDISFGISEKNYTLGSDGNVEVSLHSSGSLENFYRLVNEMSIKGRNKTNLKAIQKIVSKFKHSVNVFCGILIIPLPKVISLIFDPSKIALPNLVTLSGITILEILE